VSEEAPPEPSKRLPQVKGRLPFDPKAFDRPLQRGVVFLYALLTLGLAGLAVYMALGVGHALTSAYVAAPTIGALWFGLRLFMMLGKR
jgi:hypothetical protein